MGDFSDSLLCPTEYLYTAADGSSVVAHKSACVLGFCTDCKRRQDRFFNCPLHKAGASHNSAASSDAVPTTAGGPVRGMPGIVEWKMFTTVDDNGRPVTPSNRSRGGATADDDDDEWVPAHNTRTKQVSLAIVKTFSWAFYFFVLGPEQLTLGPSFQ